MKFHHIFLFMFISFSISAQWVQSSFNANLARALYSNGTTIYAATAEGVLYTADSGEPWINIGPQGEDIFDVITAGNKIIAANGTGHGIFISSDNGQNWQQVPSMNGKSVYSLAKNDNYIFAGTWGAGVFRSGNNGETWESAGLPQEGIRGLLTVNNMLFASSTLNGSRIYFSSDNGNTWAFSSLAYPASDIRGLFYKNGKLFACDFGLWVSTDMGRNWALQYGITFDSTGYPIDIMIFRNMASYGDYLIASVSFESIYISPDNGTSWIPFNQGIINDWTFADVEANGSYLWALREVFGNAYRRPVTDLITGIDEQVISQAGYSLEQNYPNPFNPATVIRYSLPQEEFVSIAVYNSLGEKVSSLLSETQQAGSYEVKLSGSALPSGIYFYRIEAGSFVSTKKMTLMR